MSDPKVPERRRDLLGCILTQCCVCGRPVCTEEEDRCHSPRVGAEWHDDACELSDGRWVCSSRCWDYATADLIESRQEADDPAPIPRCHKCGTPYSTHGLDITLPHDQWSALVGDGEGGVILCGLCIARAAARLPGAVAIRAHIEFAKEEPTDE